MGIKHDLSSTLSLVNIQAQMIKRALPDLMNAYALAVEQGIVKKTVDESLFGYLKEANTVMLEKIRAAQELVQNLD